MQEQTVKTVKKKPSGLAGGIAGLILLLVGIGLAVFITGRPLFMYLQSAAWERVPATVLDSRLQTNRSSDGNTYTVHARFQYRFDGQTYLSNNVSLYHGSDNLGDYWRELAGRLEQARREGRSVMVYVNPDRPDQALLDRTLRVSVMLFGFGFAGVFLLAGAGLLGWTLYRRRQVEPPVEIFSTERHAHWLPLGAGVLFMLLSVPIGLAMVEVLAGEDRWVVLPMLLFPLTGLGLLVVGWRMRGRYLYFGPSPLRPDPMPGQAGGQVGGEIRLGRPWPGGDTARVLLSCVRRRETGSGNNRSTSESTLWQREQTPFVESAGRGSLVRFCFDVPAELPASNPTGNDEICWRLWLSGEVAGRELDRGWTLPVQQGSGKSARPLPERHLQEDRQRRAVAALESAHSQILVEPEGNGLRLVSAAGRHAGVKSAFMLVGLVFAAVGGFLFYLAPREGFMLYLMAVPFTGMGLFLAGLGGWLLGRSLDARVADGRAEVTRYWAGIRVWHRQSPVSDAGQFRLDSVMRSGSGKQLVEYMRLRVADPAGGYFPLAEGIAGREAGEALRDGLLRILRLS